MPPILPRLPTYKELEQYLRDRYLSHTTFQLSADGTFDSDHRDLVSEYLTDTYGWTADQITQSWNWVKVKTSGLTLKFKTDDAPETRLWARAFEQVHDALKQVKGWFDDTADVLTQDQMLVLFAHLDRPEIAADLLIQDKGYNQNTPKTGGC